MDPASAERDRLAELGKRWESVRSTQQSAERDKEDRDRLRALAREDDWTMTVEDRRAKLRDLSTAVEGDSEASRGAILFADGSEGVHLLAGASRSLAVRAAKQRGYTVVVWVREDGLVPKFEVASICGSVRVVLEPLTNDPVNGARWRCLVSRARPRTTTMGGCRVGDFAKVGSDEGDDSRLLRWRCITVTHAGRYLSQAELTVAVDGEVFCFDDGSLCVNAPLPSADDADAFFGGDDVVDATKQRVRSSRAVLRPPALRVLHGFRGVAGLVGLYEGAMGPEALAAVRTLGPRAPSSLARDPNTAAVWAAVAKHQCIIALEPYRRATAQATCSKGVFHLVQEHHRRPHESGVATPRQPRGGAKPASSTTTTKTTSSCSTRNQPINYRRGAASAAASSSVTVAARVPTSTSVQLGAGVTWSSGEAARARRSLVALGGAPTLIAALFHRASFDAVVDALDAVSAALRHCGAAHADATVGDRGLESLGAHLRLLRAADHDHQRLLLTEEVGDALFRVIDAAAAYGGVALVEQALEALWCDDDLWAPPFSSKEDDSGPSVARAEMLVKIADRAHERTFADALRNIGLLRLARCTSQALRGARGADRQRGHYATAFEKVAFATLDAELRDASIPDDEYESYRTPPPPPGPTSSSSREDYHHHETPRYAAALAGVHAVLDALVVDTIDVDVRTALAFALCDALFKSTTEARLATVATLLRDRRFAETTALAVIAGDVDHPRGGASSTYFLPPFTTRAAAPPRDATVDLLTGDAHDDSGGSPPTSQAAATQGSASPNNNNSPAAAAAAATTTQASGSAVDTSALRGATLRLAVIQYVAAERSLRHALAVAKSRSSSRVDGDDPTKDHLASGAHHLHPAADPACAEAVSAFRAAALRSISALASLAARCLDAATWHLDAVTVCCWLINVCNDAESAGLPRGPATRRTSSSLATTGGGAPPVEMVVMPLWVSLPFVAAVANRAPRQLLESTVATLCVKIKSDETVMADLSDLEPWYTVGALVRLARTAAPDDDTVELLALDALSTLILRRGGGGGDPSSSAAAATTMTTTTARRATTVEVHRATWATTTRALSRSRSHSADWEHRALVSITAQLARRLAADAARAEFDVARAVATLLATTLEHTWPPPPTALAEVHNKEKNKAAAANLAPPAESSSEHEGFGAPQEEEEEESLPGGGLVVEATALFASKADDRSVALATAIAECARALRSAAEERRARELAALMAKPSSAAVFSRLFLGAGEADTAKPVSEAAGERARLNVDLGDATLLALRRCARALGRALFWAVDDAAMAATLAAELRATLVASLELADDRAHRGVTMAAVVACDDVMHALACCKACLEGARARRNDNSNNNKNKEDAKMTQGGAAAAHVYEATVLGLLSDIGDTTGGGVAAACCRAAFQRAACSASADAALAAVGDPVDAAFRADREDLDAMCDFSFSAEEEEDEEDDDDGGEDSSWSPSPSPREDSFAETGLTLLTENKKKSDEMDPDVAWLEAPGEGGAHARRREAARQSCAVQRRRVLAEMRAMDRADAGAREDGDAVAETFRADVSLELALTPDQDDADDDQRRWEPAADLGDGLCCPPIVADRATTLVDPFRPHDETKYVVERATHNKRNQVWVAKTKSADVSVIDAASLDHDLAKKIKLADVSDAASPTTPFTDEVLQGGVTQNNNNNNNNNNKSNKSNNINNKNPRPPNTGGATPGTTAASRRRGESLDSSASIASGELLTEDDALLLDQGFQDGAGVSSSSYSRTGPSRADVVAEAAQLNKALVEQQPASDTRHLLASCARCTRVTAEKTTVGSLTVTSGRLVFRAAEYDSSPSDGGGHESIVARGPRVHAGFARALGDCRAVLLRRHRLRDTAVEAYFRHGSILIDCYDDEDEDEGERDEGGEATRKANPPGGSASSVARAKSVRDEVARKLCAAVRAKVVVGGGGSSAVLPLLEVPGHNSIGPLVQRCTRAWQERRLDNYGYLLAVNALAGRSFNDTCQYPVFPWVLADYESEALDLAAPRTFRDLSKPMGALNAVRLEETVSRYESFDDLHVPKFHYGSHYSTSAGVVSHFLLRLAPRFAALHCDLQSGRFDVADRLFTSVADAWAGNSGAAGSKASSEVKELVPEFYSTPSFLTNEARLPLGFTQEGVPVDDVHLPPWAQGSPHRFVARHRAALESDYVSHHLHSWVDLIFGVKQRGQAAVDSANVFFYLCYADTVDVEAITDPALRKATVLQAAHFGQCPAQLWKRKAHPPRGPSTGLPRSLGLEPFGADDGKGGGYLAPAPGTDASAVARTVGLGGSYRATATLALRATANRCVVVNGAGALCVLAWSYDRAAVDDDDALLPQGSSSSNPNYSSGENENDSSENNKVPVQQQKRVASVRALAAAAEVDGEEKLARRAASHLGEDLAPTLVDVSDDGTIVAAVDDEDPTALRVVEVDLFHGDPPHHQHHHPHHQHQHGGGGSSSASSLSAASNRAQAAAVVGDASVVAHAAPLTLVRCIEERPQAAYGAEDAAATMLILCGCADGTASLWRVDQQTGRGRWSPLAAFHKLRPATVTARAVARLRGHGAAVTAGDASPSLECAVTGAADGAVLVHSLSSGTLLRRLASDREGLAAPRHCAVTAVAGGVAVIARPVTAFAFASSPEGGAVLSTTTSSPNQASASSPPDSTHTSSSSSSFFFEVRSLSGPRRRRLQVATDGSWPAQENDLLAQAVVDFTPARVRIVGDLGDMIMIVGGSIVELREVLTLEPRRQLRLAMGPDSTLCDFDLAPDGARPAALFVATSTGDVALRVLAGADDWADKNFAHEDGIGSFIAKRAGAAMGLAAAALGKGRSLASATSDVVGEAREALATKRPTLSKPLLSKEKAVVDLFVRSGR